MKGQIKLYNFKLDRTKHIDVNCLWLLLHSLSSDGNLIKFRHTENCTNCTTFSIHPIIYSEKGEIVAFEKKYMILQIFNEDIDLERLYKHSFDFYCFKVLEGDFLKESDLNMIDIMKIESVSNIIENNPIKSDKSVWNNIELIWNSYDNYKAIQRFEKCNYSNISESDIVIFKFEPSNSLRTMENLMVRVGVIKKVNPRTADIHPITKGKGLSDEEMKKEFGQLKFRIKYAHLAKII